MFLLIFLVVQFHMLPGFDCLNLRNTSASGINLITIFPDDTWMFQCIAKLDCI